MEQDGVGGRFLFSFTQRFTKPTFVFLFSSRRYPAGGRAGGPLIPVPPPGIWYRRPPPPAVCPISQICRARVPLLPTGGCTFTALLPLRSSLSRVRPTTKSGLRPADGGGEGEKRKRREREEGGGALLNRKGAREFLGRKGEERRGCLKYFTMFPSENSKKGGLDVAVNPNPLLVPTTQCRPHGPPLPFLLLYLLQGFFPSGDGQRSKGKGDCKKGRIFLPDKDERTDGQSYTTGRKR